MKIAKIIFASIGGLIVLLALIFGLQYFSIVNLGFFSPKYQNVQRNVFENTQSYTEGKRQDLVKYYHEWLTADKTSRQGLKSIVLDDFSNCDISKLTPSEKQMYDEMTGDEGN